jgi:FixJ family two-component response regulator
MKKEIKPLVRLIDDDETVLRAEASFLEIAGINVRCYRGAQAFLKEDDFTVPGCIVLDVRMPGMSGIELQTELKSKDVRLPIIFLSAHGDIEMAVEAVKRGALNFLTKPPRLDKLLELIGEALDKDRKRREFEAWKADLDRAWEELTAQERQVAEMVAKGLPSTVIAEAVGLTEKTVRNYRANIYNKLDVVNAVELAGFLHERESLKETLKS